MESSVEATKNNILKKVFVEKKLKKSSERLINNYKGHKGEIQDDEKKSFTKFTKIFLKKFNSETEASEEQLCPVNGCSKMFLQTFSSDSCQLSTFPQFCHCEGWNKWVEWQTERMVPNMCYNPVVQICWNSQHQFLHLVPIMKTYSRNKLTSPLLLMFFFCGKKSLHDRSRYKIRRNTKTTIFEGRNEDLVPFCSPLTAFSSSLNRNWTNLSRSKLNLKVLFSALAFYLTSMKFIAA